MKALEEWRKLNPKIPCFSWSPKASIAPHSLALVSDAFHKNFVNFCQWLFLQELLFWYAPEEFSTPNCKACVKHGRLLHALTIEVNSYGKHLKGF